MSFARAMSAHDASTHASTSYARPRRHRARRHARIRAAASDAARAAAPDSARASASSQTPRTSTHEAQAREAAARAVKTPHSGYHRQPNVERAFFEGWYFRVTLPAERRSASLIYHVYDPDVARSARRGVGAQVCAPNGKYLYKTTTDTSAFEAAPHALELQLACADGDFFSVAGEGSRHAGRLTSVGEADDGPWGRGLDAREVAWDFTVTPLRGWGGGANAKQLSPAGWMTALPVFEPHWQVTMAHGIATGWIETDGERVEFSQCPAYSEKNWGGAGFPLKWWWVQCNSFADFPDLSVTATGGNRGVVVVPNMREDVGAVGVHFGDRFFQFVPAHQGAPAPPTSYGAEAAVEASAVRWDVAWGAWSVSAISDRYEVSIEGACTDDDKSTVIRAPTDTLDGGMAPLCRETFTGVVTLSLWRLDASGARVETVIDAARSTTACLEIGGGPWRGRWKSAAEIRGPLAPLMSLPVDVGAVADFLKPAFGDVFPGF